MSYLTLIIPEENSVQPLFSFYYTFLNDFTLEVKHAITTYLMSILLTYRFQTKNRMHWFLQSAILLAYSKVSQRYI